MQHGPVDFRKLEGPILRPAFLVKPQGVSWNPAIGNITAPLLGRPQNLGIDPGSR